MAEVWPDRLPLPTFEGYAISPDDPILRTNMEQGPSRQRQQFTTVPEKITVRWRFTQWQMALFRSWFRYKAKRGAEWFSITLLTGLGMVPHEVQFVGDGSKAYTATPTRGDVTGAKWIVTASLTVRDSPDLSEDVLDLALVENMDGLIAAMAGAGTLVNTTLPNLAA